MTSVPTSEKFMEFLYSASRTLLRYSRSGLASSFFKNWTISRTTRLVVDAEISSKQTVLTVKSGLPSTRKRSKTAPWRMSKCKGRISFFSFERIISLMLLSASRVASPINASTETTKKKRIWSYKTNNQPNKKYSWQAQNPQRILEWGRWHFHTWPLILRSFSIN